MDEFTYNLGIAWGGKDYDKLIVCKCYVSLGTTTNNIKEDAKEIISPLLEYVC